MPYFPFQLATLKAIAHFCSDDDTRYVLNGLNIELHRGQSALIVATDGRRLLRYSSGWMHSHEEETPYEFILPTSVIDALDWGSERSSHFEISSGKITLTRGEGGFMSVQCRAIPGPFPNWRTVVPEKLPETFPPRRLVANRILLHDLIETLCFLEKDSEQIEFLGEEAMDTPLYARSAHALAVLMPMRDKLPA